MRSKTLEQLHDRWTVSKARDLYGVDNWGAGYFRVNAESEVCVCPDSSRPEAAASLVRIVHGLRERGYDLPVLLRFEDILASRIRLLNKSFATAMKNYGYRATCEASRSAGPRDEDGDGAAGREDAVGGAGGAGVGHAPIFLLYFGRESGKTLRGPFRGSSLLTDASSDRTLDHSLLRPRRPARAVRAWRARRRWVQLALLFVATALIVNALIGERGLVAAVRARHEHERLAASIGGLKQDNQRLAEAIRRLKHDPKAVEAVARTDLGLIRPGEVVFVIKDAPSVQPRQTAVR